MCRTRRFLDVAPFLDLVRRCKTLRSFKQIHAQLVTSGTIEHCDGLLVNQSIGFLASSVHNLEYACNFLNQIRYNLSSFPFNTLIAGYAGSDTPWAAILAYKRIVRNGFLADKYTFPVLVKSCAKVLGIVEGKQVHGVVEKMGFSSDLFVQNSFVHLYGVCCYCNEATKLFDEMPVRDVVSWNALISGYVKAGLFGEAMNLFMKIDVDPNEATVVNVLVACGRLRNLGAGRVIQGLIFKGGFEMSLEIGNALMDMYLKSECMDEARQLFDELPNRDIISWTCIISGLVQCKRPKEALELFRTMQSSGVDPDKMTLASVLSACASLGAFVCGRWVHEYIERCGIESDIYIGTALIDMYAKCGCVEMAMDIFHGMRQKNVLTWNALLGGLAMHGLGKEALKYYEQMIRTGLRPNEVTFLAILSACCHSGLVEQGRRHFYLMFDHDHNLTPRIEHYGCMVDLLGRAGLVNEAQGLILTMPMQPDELIWGALLSACKAHGDVELSRHILDKLLELESHDSGIYVLLSNIFAVNGRWEDVTRVRRLMKNRSIRKVPGSSVIEVNGSSHEFFVGDTEHSHMKEIHHVLNMLAKQAHLEGQIVHHKFQGIHFLHEI
ncbi:pentatricopeptide repeat-containing protein At4g38010 [Macadamia integrifolia]|uniref:pentatricopeptide repeat-containing protein At4g38010 n=1 Tax=Macadamia integrifolia TaxID=60698 RepID=UPI001C4EAD9D|nr:pentatricopeptide repeat-containing protein At4g38010 [Macadamia integrifolia]